MSEEETIAKKILVLGLDNAGKSSILKIVQEKMLDPIQDESPTKGVARSEMEILGQKIVIHDLGGQRKYKIQYLDNPTYFEKTDVLIFVLDLQDKDRYELALDYYEGAMSILDKLMLFPELFIFMHKFDGEYEEDYDDINTRVRLEYDHVSDEFKKIARTHGRSIEYVFQTTIFDEWSCYVAFNAAWTAVVPKLVSMQEFLDKLGEENEEISIALLLDEKGSVLAKKLRYHEGIDMENLADIAARSVMLLLSWQKTLENEAIDKTDFAILEIEEESVMIQKLNTATEVLYLLIYVIGGDYKEFQERFKNIAFTLENLL